MDDPRLLALSTIACSVPPGGGGLGQHFEELRQLARTTSLGSVQCIYPSPHPASEPGHIAVRQWIRGGRRIAHVPNSHAYPLFVQAACLTFDLAASRAISSNIEGFTGFASHSLLTFRRARRLGIPYLG